LDAARVSKSRAKKKQRRRARAAGGERASAGERPGAGEQAARLAGAPERPGAPRAATRSDAAPRHPSRLEIRDGVPRPDAIWAPFPLTELGMGVGLVLFLIGFAGAPACC